MGTCVGCGRDLPAPTGSRPPRNPRKWCSAACSARYARYPDGLTERTCPRCDATFMAAGHKKVYCTPRCGWLHARAIRPKNPDWLMGRQPERPVRCRDCGVESVERACRWRCPPCAKLARADVNRRKSIKRKTGRPSGAIKVGVIGDRDGWRCHLCHKHIDKTLSGLHPAGPNIDHLVPLAFGGADEPANVAISHRRCNVARGTGGTVQLRLVA